MMGRCRAGRKRKAGLRHPSGQLVKKKKRETDAEIHLHRAARAGRLPRANRGLWEMGRPAEALKGTSVRKDDKRMAGPDVPPLGFRDGAETIDAIGRAWAGRLLEGREIESTRLRDRAREIAGLYWRHLCPRGATTVSSLYANMVSEENPSAAARPVVIAAEAEERERRQEARLLRIVRLADAQGQEARAAFDELVIDINPECGPPWLDRLLSPKPNSESDLRKLDKALRCLGVVLR